jgi:hypothetical protein
VTPDRGKYLKGENGKSRRPSNARVRNDRSERQGSDGRRPSVISKLPVRSIPGRGRLVVEWAQRFFQGMLHQSITVQEDSDRLPGAENGSNAFSYLAIWRYRSAERGAARFSQCMNALNLGFSHARRIPR